MRGTVMQKEVPTASAATGEASPPSGLARLLLSLDRPFRFVANLTSLGIVSVIVAALIQYSSWRDDKQLTRHKEELSGAISSFSEIAGFLSAAMNLQQILYFTHKNAAGAFGANNPQQLNYLLMSAKSILADYTASRLTLRKSVDVLIGKSDLFIDRPARPEAQRSVTNVAKTDDLLVFSNRDILRGQGFRCSEHLSQPEPINLKTLSIDWQQTRNHVGTFYYCLEDLHTRIFDIRVWAHAAEVQPAGQPDEKTTPKPAVQLSDEDKKQIEHGFDLQTRRLNDFIAVTTARIEEMRLRTNDNGFLRHQFCFWCRD
jgi:hypothetical protein